VSEQNDVSSDNPAQNTTFASNGGQAYGYLALPESGSGPGVIVIQEWWGLTDYIVGVADRLAKEGFVALAPDLFGGKTTHDSGEAGRLMSELPVEKAATDLSGAVDFLLEHPAVSSSKVGAVGFCMGGGFVLLLAAQQGDKIGAAVPFYGVGTGVPDRFTGITAPVQGHYAEDDQFYPVAEARKQEQQIRQESGAEVEFFYYPAGHAFHAEHDLLGTYDPDAAKLSWQRTVEFLHAKLG
jgi:carboxymethylenebutenolidase